MTRPRIALTVSSSRSPDNLAARERYERALRQAGADVVICEPRQEIPVDVAGVCFSGGGDIAPERYGAVDRERVCENVLPERDEIELTLARHALDADIPVLGVCRGFQLLNVALGGSLVMHVDGHQAKGDDVIAHVVEPEAGSRLARATGAAPMRVNSRHHQAVTLDGLAPSLRPTVLYDGLVEAYESDTKRWLVAVQWHPERSAEVDEPACRIFEAFVAEARRSAVHER